MKTQNILLPLAAFAAGVFIANKNKSSIGGLYDPVTVVGKKDGQLVQISELPMIEKDAHRWIKEQGIERYYKNVETIPYHGNKPIHKLAGNYGESVFLDAKILSKQQKTTMYVVTRPDGENVVVPLDDISFEQAAYPGIKIIAIYNKGLPVFTPNFAMQK